MIDLHRYARGIIFTACVALNPFQVGAVEEDRWQEIQTALGISTELAHVSDADWIPSSQFPDFILIQDVHRHPHVQSQIRALIEQGYRAWGVKKVFVEGAFTPLDLSVFHRVPTRTRALLMDRLVKEGTLTGPEMAAIQILELEWRDPPASPFQLFGMEEPSLYRQNVLAYQDVLASRDRALEDLVTVRRQNDAMHLSEPNALACQVDRLEALVRLKLTSSNYEAYLQARDAVPPTPAMLPAVRAAENYYRIAQERSQAFLRQAGQRVPASTAPRILVEGGFHTATMAGLLRRQGRTFVILSPSVDTSEEDPLYERRMLETTRVLADASHIPAR